MDIRAAQQERFAIFRVAELRLRIVELGVERAKQLHEHEVGFQATELPVDVLEAESLLPALIRDERKHAEHFCFGAQLHIVEDFVEHFGES